MLGMKNHLDKYSSIEIRKVDIAGVACIHNYAQHWLQILATNFENKLIDL